MNNEDNKFYRKAFWLYEHRYIDYTRIGEVAEKLKMQSEIDNIIEESEVKNESKQSIYSTDKSTRIN